VEGGIVSKSPNLDFYRRRAKALLKLAQSGDPEALQRFNRHHPDFRETSPGGIVPENLALNQAQLVIARENGFSSWPRLKAYVDALKRSPAQTPEDHLQSILRARDLDALAAFMEKHPGAIHFRVEPLGYTPLHIAASNGWEEGAMQLLDAGADINAVSRTFATTPLRVAIGYGQPALALFLLERGADPTVAESDEKTTMQSAAYAGNKDIIRALAARGIEVDIFSAVTLEDEARVRDLVQRDASVLCRRMRSFQNVTIPPLHLAAFHNSPSMIDVLLALGANPNDTDEQGRTAIDLSLHGGKRKAYERLQAHGCKANPQLLEMVQSPERSERIARLHQALVDGDLERTTRELDADPTLINQRFPDVWGTGGTFGASPLHWAAMFGHIDLARLLLQRGGDVSLRDLTYGGTPAHWAKEYRRREMCALLEANGAECLNNDRGQKS
jgi:ankyrin repeat protein